MTKSLVKNTFREIANTKARFISIMAIIALGVGFFAGIKATAPSMYNLAETYYKNQQLMDYRLVSTVGFDKDDIEAISKVEGVISVMPSYYGDVLKSAESGGHAVRVIALPTAYENNTKLNELAVMEGRLPEKSGEVVVENSSITSQKYNVGDTISLAPRIDDKNTTDTLKMLDFTVVGKVESPLYISYQRGSTTIGDGKLTEFMYIMPEDFALEKYTELYVKTDISEKYSAFSSEYTDKINEFKNTLKNIADDRCKVFETDVIGKGRQELDDAKKDYDEQKNDAEQKLGDAEQELKNGKKELDEKTFEAEQELDNALAKIQSGRNDLATAKNEYYTKIAEAEQTLNEKQQELDEAVAEYENSKAEFEEKFAFAQQELDQKFDEYNKAYDYFKSVQEPQLLAGIEQAQQTVDYLNYLISITTDEKQLEILKQQLEQAQNVLDGLKIQHKQAVEEFENNKALLDEAQLEIDNQKEDAQKQLDLAKQQIDEGSLALQNGWAEFETQKTDGYNQLVQAENQLDSAQAQYDNGEAEFKTQTAEGEKKLEDGEEEYEKQRKEADEKFAEAKDEIDESEKKLDDVAEPEWYVFTRDDNVGYSTFSQNADRLDAVASVFPVFFLLVAVLVCVTTMTRLIEEKRTEIGTFKALGYSNASIIAKFVFYSLIAGVSGGLIGTVIGVLTMPFIIYNAYKIMYYIGDITLVLNVPSIILGLGAAILCTTAVSIIVCRKTLVHKPASIMRPKAPKAGKRIFLEHITPLWSHMNFTSKLTARNLLRYKSRLCMTVIGVAGCCALIVAAFGLLNSFDPLTNDQFDSIFKYDAVIVPKNGGTAQELEYLNNMVDTHDNITDHMLVLSEDVTMDTGSKHKDDGTTLVVVENPSQLDSIISLHDRITKEKLSLSDSGVMINEKLAKELSLNVGDKITLNSDSGTAEVTVDGIYEQYINNYIYMTPALYKSLYGKDVKYNMLDAVMSDKSEKAEQSFSSHCLADSRIAAVTYIASSINDFKNMLNSLNMVVMVMIICAAALAFVVLYNLTNINIAERVREIATFKVLGFYNKETSAFIFIENIVLTLLGIFAGMFLGIFLTEFIVSTVEVNNVMFGRDVYITSYLYAGGLTMLFSLLVLFVMSFKIKAVNMVESLKSVE